jgi:Ca-activated chloride channel family protein
VKRYSWLGVLCLVAACGGGVAATTTTTSGEVTTTVTNATTSTTARSNATVSLDLPAEVGAGTDFTVEWTGPNNQGDYVALASTGAADGTYESYFYTGHGPTGTLLAPVDAGEYEVRYVDGETDSTVYSVTISVLPFLVELTPPESITGGTEFEVEWSGPDGPGDYVTIVPVGSADGFYESYFYTADGNPGVLVAPVIVDTYEIRYVTGQAETLGSVEIPVTQFVVTLEAPAEVGTGDNFDVNWTGPAGPGDYITIAPAGSAVGTYLDYKYVNGGNPLSLTAPPDPGNYEIRYVSERVPDLIFEAIPLVVG